MQVRILPPTIALLACLAGCSAPDPLEDGSKSDRPMQGGNMKGSDVSGVALPGGIPFAHLYPDVDLGPTDPSGIGMWNAFGLFAGTRDSIGYLLDAVATTRQLSCSTDDQCDAGYECVASVCRRNALSQYDAHGRQLYDDAGNTLIPGVRPSCMYGYHKQGPSCLPDNAADDALRRTLNGPVIQLLKLQLDADGAVLDQSFQLDEDHPPVQHYGKVVLAEKANRNLWEACIGEEFWVGDCELNDITGVPEYLHQWQSVVIDDEACPTGTGCTRITDEGQGKCTPIGGFPQANLDQDGKYVGSYAPGTTWDQLPGWTSDDVPDPDGKLRLCGSTVHDSGLPDDAAALSRTRGSSWWAPGSAANPGAMGYSELIFRTAIGVALGQNNLADIKLATGEGTIVDVGLFVPVHWAVARRPGYYGRNIPDPYWELMQVQDMSTLDFSSACPAANQVPSDLTALPEDTQQWLAACQRIMSDGAFIVYDEGASFVERYLPTESPYTSVSSAYADSVGRTALEDLRDNKTLINDNVANGMYVIEDLSHCVNDQLVLLGPTYPAVPDVPPWQMWLPGGAFPLAGADPSAAWRCSHYDDIPGPVLPTIATTDAPWPTVDMWLTTLDERGGGGLAFPVFYMFDGRAFPQDTEEGN